MKLQKLQLFRVMLSVNKKISCQHEVLLCIKPNSCSLDCCTCSEMHVILSFAVQFSLKCSWMRLKCVPWVSLKQNYKSHRSRLSEKSQLEVFPNSCSPSPYQTQECLDGNLEESPTFSTCRSKTSSAAPPCG